MDPVHKAEIEETFVNYSPVTLSLAEEFRTSFCSYLSPSQGISDYYLADSLFAANGPANDINLSVRTHAVVFNFLLDYFYHAVCLFIGIITAIIIRCSRSGSRGISHAVSANISISLNLDISLRVSIIV